MLFSVFCLDNVNFDDVEGLVNSKDDNGCKELLLLRLYRYCYNVLLLMLLLLLLFRLLLSNKCVFEVLPSQALSYTLRKGPVATLPTAIPGGGKNQCASLYCGGGGGGGVLCKMITCDSGMIAVGVRSPAVPTSTVAWLLKFVRVASFCTDSVPVANVCSVWRKLLRSFAH
uniref:TBC1 domain family member 24 n=2 Tax=Lygus hesperus TaxID=30085 RepID=A0A0A9YZ42_LYGHE